MFQCSAALNHVGGEGVARYSSVIQAQTDESLQVGWPDKWCSETEPTCPVGPLIGTQGCWSRAKLVSRKGSVGERIGIANGERQIRLIGYA